MVTEGANRFRTDILLAIGVVLFGAVFISRFRPTQLLVLDLGRFVLAALFVVLAAIACGRLAGFRRMADQVVAGFPIFGTICGALALVDTRLLLPLTVAGACLGAYFTSRADRASGQAPPLLLVPPFLLALLAALAPVSSPDELIYKLAVPRAWLMHGRMIELPLHSNSYLAMALQGVDLAALSLAGGVAAKLAHLALYAATLVVATRVAGKAGAILLAWTPALAIIAGWAWSEWGVIGALLLCYERWREGDVRGSAIAAGCAVATKYTALPWLLAFAVLVWLRKRDQLVRVLAIVGAVGGWFYLRNLVWTGSPIAPLLLPDAPEIEQYAGSGLANLIRAADIFDPRIIDESLGILMPLAAIAGVFAWRTQPDLVLLGAVQMPFLLAIAPGSRNIVTGVVPLALAGVLAFYGGMRLRILKGLFTLALLAQFSLVLFVMESYEMTRYVAGRETTAEYLQRTRNFAAPYAWIGKNTTRESRILLLAETRAFHLDRKAIWAGNLDGPRMARWLSAPGTPEALGDRLRSESVTHVLIHKPWYRVGDSPLTILEKEYVLSVPAATHANLMRFLATRASRVYEDRQYVIYRVVH